MLEGVPLDKCTQDERIIKMKLWLAADAMMNKLMLGKNNILDVNIQTVKSSSLNIFRELKSKTSSMLDLFNDIEEAKEDKKPKQIEKYNKQFARYNKKVEPLA